MAQEALLAINDINYSGSITNINQLHQALDGGSKSIPYTQLIHFLTNELRTSCDIDEQINPIQSSDDSSTFLMELSSFLKELGCPYECLTQGHLSDRLTSKKDKLLLITYLTSELMTVRMCPPKKAAKTIELKLQESAQALHLRHLLQAFRISKPPANLTIQSLFQKLTPIVDRAVKGVPAQLLSTPALNATLTAKQWQALGSVQTDLHNEYKIRREMLLKRLDCTIQSFQWSDRMKGKEGEIDRVFNITRKQLSIEPDVSLAHLLCAREDLAVLEKTSNASVRKNTKSAVNRVIIGQVPDRGGRSWEQAPPPPEMPSWQQRTGAAFGDQRGGRGNYHSHNNTFAPHRYKPSGSGYNKPPHIDSRSSLGNMSVYAAYQESLTDFKNTHTDKRNYTTSFDADSATGGFSRGDATVARAQGGYSSYYSSSPTGGAASYQAAGGFDSAGAYGGRKYEDTKRHKQFDSFQTGGQMSQAEQYVQETQQNQQYRGGRGGRFNSGRGKRNY